MDATPSSVPEPDSAEDARTIGGKGGRLPRKRCGGDGAGFELTIGAAADPAAKPLGW
jgi:hypothetical protein